jgi:hypothetical protein
VIRNEYVETLADLVERRLMLLYHRPLTYACLNHLVDLLKECGKLAYRGNAETIIADEVARLKAHYGKRVE